MTEQQPQALTIVISAMGGQGGGVLARWIVDVAEQGGYIAQATSVPGVAQRTGATIYYIELFPRSVAEAAGKDPVLALMPIPGQVDLLIAAELVEAGRAVLRGLATPERTTVVASSHREYAVAEKVALGDGIADGDKIREAVQRAAKRCVLFDMAQLAASTDSVISAVLLGAVAAVGRLPFARAEFEATIRRSGVGVEPSLMGFAAGWEGAIGQGEAATSSATVAAVAAGAGSEAASPEPASARGRALLQRVNDTFQPAVQPMVLEGLRRVTDYQDLRYGADYLDRLDRIRALDSGGDDRQHRLTRETARYLALWMSYEDAPRVADLKTRRARFERIRQQVRAEPSQLVYPVDFLHPSVREISDVLPAAIGRFIMEHPRLRAFVDRLVNHGRRVPVGKLRGFLLLYLVAGLRRFRRLSYRYRQEMERIAGWLDRIARVAAFNHELAVEIARCPRLLKGYGDTHERGLRNFEAVMQALPQLESRGDAAEAVRRLTEAALADEDGTALQAELAKVLPAA